MQTVSSKKICGLVLEAEPDILENIIKMLEHYPTVRLLYVRKQKFQNSFMLIIELRKQKE